MFAPAPASIRPDAYRLFARDILIVPRLTDELRAADDRVAGARRYLAEAGCNVALGEAHLTRLRDRRSGIRARLHAARLA